MGLRDRILEYIRQAETSLPPATVTAKIAAETGVGRREVRAALSGLIAQGAIGYVEQFGRTCLIPGLHRPVPVGDHTVLLPPGVALPESLMDRSPVVLQFGASFGTGSHPTTRLCIQGLEAHAVCGGRVLDIGTGSGVLVIAAIRQKMAEGLGVDTDPVAVHEAKENVALNGLSAVIGISETWNPDERWDLVVANLRTPTLKALAPVVQHILHPGGRVVLSGMREEEMDGVRNVYGNGMEECMCLREKGWGCLCFS